MKLNLFCAVDENEDSIYSIASDPEDQPLYDDIESEVVQRNLKGKPRPALPPMNLKPAFSQGDINQMVYEEAVFDVDPNNNYHMLKDNGSLESSLDKGSGVRDEWYDDMGINDAVVYNMNKCPPPIWRPEIEERLAPPLPPNRRAVSSEPDDRLKVLLDASRPQLLDFSHRRPVPPPKPQRSSGAAFSPSRGSGQDLFGIKDNPMFKQKLQQKRQELYGDSRHMRSLSMGEGEDLAQECYESVLYTVDDTRKEDVPKLPPRTELLRNECLLQLFAQKGTGGSGSSHGHPPSMPESRSARISSPITPTSPPPLPSRELLDPMLPSYRGSPQPPPTTQDEEVPPPVPLRDSSKQPPPLPHVRLPESERRNSLPSSQTPRIDRSKPLPLPLELPPPLPHTLLSSSSPSHLLRDIKGRSQDRALPPTPPELSRMQEKKPYPGFKPEGARPHTPHQEAGGVGMEPQELVYDDIVPGQSNTQSPNEKDTYDDIRPLSPPPPAQQRFAADPWTLPPKSNMIALPPKPATGQQKGTSPVSNGPLLGQQVPKWQKDASPMRQPQQRANKNPPLPPNKPDIAPGSRGLGTVSNGVIGDQSSKPQVARKPLPPKKPVALVTKKPPVSKKPPTQPKPTSTPPANPPGIPCGSPSASPRRIPSSTGGSPPSVRPPVTKPRPPPSAKPLPGPQTLGHKPKPIVPKKPIIPLCS